MNGYHAGALMGLSREDWLRTRPALGPDDEAALAVWWFCRGWEPALIPAAAAYYQVDDLQALIARLLAIRETIEAYDRARRETERGPRIRD